MGMYMWQIKQFFKKVLVWLGVVLAAYTGFNWYRYGTFKYGMTSGLKRVVPHTIQIWERAPVVGVYFKKATRFVGLSGKASLTRGKKQRAYKGVSKRRSKHKKARRRRK